ncbi:MAG: hypothetical protein J6J39_05310 [Clostridia bacterium]|nr:hypothetical protein [Clostridia bacterium]
MLPEKIEHIFEPDPLQCGQAVLSMLTGKSVDEIIMECGTQRETDLKCMKRVLEDNGMHPSGDRKAVTDKKDLPDVALLSLETPKCWHWSLYFKGLFYDPEYGLLEDFPPSNRRYFWEISEKF